VSLAHNKLGAAFFFLYIAGEGVAAISACGLKWRNTKKDTKVPKNLIDELGVADISMLQHIEAGDEGAEIGEKGRLELD
jgi:hypothetical protein